MPTINATDIGANSSVFEYTAEYDLAEFITAFSSKLVSYGWTLDLTESTPEIKYFNCVTKNGSGTYKKGLRVTFTLNQVKTEALEYTEAGVYENNTGVSIDSPLTPLVGGYVYLFASPAHYYTAVDGNDLTFTSGDIIFCEFTRDDGTVESAVDTHRWGALNLDNILTKTGYYNRSLTYGDQNPNYSFIIPTSGSYEGAKTVESVHLLKFQSAGTNLFAWGCAYAGGYVNQASGASSNESITYKTAYGHAFNEVPLFFPANFAVEPSFVTYNAVQANSSHSYTSLPDKMQLFGRPIGLKMVKDVELRNVAKMPITNMMLDAGGVPTDHFVIWTSRARYLTTTTDVATATEVSQNIGFALPL